MSKVGKQPVEIPQGVEVKIDRNLVSVKGPKGELKKEFPREIKVEVSGTQAIVSVAKETKKTIALWGLCRALLNNMVKGVSTGFEKILDMEGVGCKVVAQGKDLVFSLGFSHPVPVKAVPGIDFKIEKNSIIISGMDKEQVGQVAANIRALRKPEPYKGKGIRYRGEIIKRKAGKKAVKGGF